MHHIIDTSLKLIIDGEHHCGRQRVMQWQALYTFAAHVVCTDPDDCLSRQIGLWAAGVGVCQGFSRGHG